MLESQDGKLSSNSAFSVICCQMMHRALGKHDQRCPLCRGADGIRDVSVLLGGRKSTQLCCTTRMWHAVISSIRGKHTNTGGVSPDRDFRSRGSALRHSAWCLVPSLWVCRVTANWHSGHGFMTRSRIPPAWQGEERRQSTGIVAGAWCREAASHCLNPSGAPAQALGTSPVWAKPREARRQSCRSRTTGCLAGTSDRWKAGCVQGTYGRAVALDVDFLNQERVWRNELCRGRAACGSPGQSHSQAWICMRKGALETPSCPQRMRWVSGENSHPFVYSPYRGYQCWYSI